MVEELGLCGVCGGCGCAESGREFEQWQSGEFDGG